MTGIQAVGLGPAGLDWVSPRATDILLDPGATVVVRTLEHPAARELAAKRQVVTCDDLYESADTFDDVYASIVTRLVDLAASGPVVYAVPGSPIVGERVVGLLRQAGVPVALVGAPSFIEAALGAVGVDPLERGLAVLDAHDLPYPLLLGLPTLIGQLDSATAIDAVRDGLLTVLDADAEVTLVTDAGGERPGLLRLPLGELRASHAGLRVSLFVDVPAPGWPGLVQTSARLRQDCPWDREQTHHSLAKHLLEEAHEVLESIERLPSEAPLGEPDVAGYVELEEELGDLLIQVVLHATLASEAGMFGIEEVAEGIRRKLVARHPHVFGTVAASTPEQVMANWEEIKQDEKGRQSRLDGIPIGLPALARAFETQARAASVGFDWPSVDGPLDKVAEEVAELAGAGESSRSDEFGDLLFSMVNVARHLGIDPEQALRRTVSRFERRFRAMEAEGDIAKLTLEEMDERWEQAKGADS
ncbi:MAG TPA: nucleoside triphosphate pyrophosphohydrolase [Acidimicrobiia bacterium]|nr:nucleoside triphosphate pyrophosphohydrolase [Acidimicrobiia bacterium]